MFLLMRAATLGAIPDAPLQRDPASLDIEGALAALAELTVIDTMPTPSNNQVYAAVKAKLASVSERLVLVEVKSKRGVGAYAVWRHSDINAGQISTLVYKNPKHR